MAVSASREDRLVDWKELRQSGRRHRRISFILADFRPWTRPEPESCEWTGLRG